MKFIYKMLKGTSLPGVTVGLMVLSSVNMQGDPTRFFLTHNITYNNEIEPKQAPGPGEAQYLPMLSAVATLKYPN